MTELERFKVILATICLEHEDMKLGPALMLAEEIETRMHTEKTLEGATADPDPDDFTERTPHSVVDAWVRTQTDLVSMDKIHGIKEIRARAGLGLKNAKDAYERVFGVTPWGTT